MNQPRSFPFQMLFASPLFNFSIKDYVSLNSELIVDAHALRKEDAGLHHSNQHGWHSRKDLFRWKEASFKKLCRAIVNSLHTATKEVAPEFNHAGYDLQLQGWININDRGAFNAPHDHPGFCWSGCYYVKIPESSSGRSGLIEFLDPRTNISTMSVPESKMFAPKFQVKPREGLLLIFPSYLKHWVYPNEQNEERISIAFNARFIKKEKIICLDSQYRRS